MKLEQRVLIKGESVANVRENVKGKALGHENIYREDEKVMNP